MRATRFASAVGLVATSVLAGCLFSTGSPEAPGAELPRFSATHVFEGVFDTTGPYSRVLQDGPHSILPYEVVEIESDVDGAKMQIGVYRPDFAKPVPVVVHASPYFTTLRGEMSPDERHGLAQYGEAYSGSLVGNLVPHGYAVALVPLRGTADNGGCLDIWGGPLERTDLAQALDWLAGARWSSGAIGVIGLSYEANAAWSAAATSEHVRTIVPVGGFADAFRLVVRNGTAGADFVALPAAGGPFIWTAFGQERSADHVVSGTACDESGQAAIHAPPVAITRERDMDGWWNDRDLEPLVERGYGGSVFLVHGFEDDPMSRMYPWITSLEAGGVEVKHLLGQWGHHWPDTVAAGDHRRWDFAEILFRWFERELKDKVVDVGPRAQVQDSLGQWRSAEAWPPSGVPRALYATPDGGLVDTDPGSTATITIAGADAARDRAYSATGTRSPECDSCVVFTMNASAELRFAGIPTFHATVTPHSPQALLTVELYEVRSGSWGLLTHQRVDLRFAHGGEDARDMTPGEPIDLRLWMQPVDAVVRANGQLALVLSQRNDAPPGGPQNWALSNSAWTEVASGPLDIQIGGGSSILTLDTFQVRPTDTFALPWSQDRGAVT